MSSVHFVFNNEFYLLGEKGPFLVLKTQDLTGLKLLELSLHYSSMWGGDYCVSYSKGKLS